MFMIGKKIPVDNVNNAIGNKNVGHDHFRVIDEDISILYRDLDGLAPQGLENITIMEVGAVQRLTRSHN